MQIGNENYEILIRRQGENVYAAFCPQLELIVRGTAHEQVENKMKELIADYVAKRDAGESTSETQADSKPDGQPEGQP
jgi:hypothetical protein